MPEGDTIHYAANRIRAVLQGQVPDEISLPHPRFGDGRLAERLAGRRVELVDARGKHLFIHFQGDLLLHSHLRMTGSWRVLRAGALLPRSVRRLWLVARAGGHQVLQFDGPVLELLTETRLRNDPRLNGLGPDIVAEADFDEAGFLARLRQDDPTRAIGDALLNQRSVAGIGNIWKCEGCFDARVDPWRPLETVSDDEALAIVRAARPRMQRSAREGFRARDNRVYARHRRPCRACGGPIECRGQGDGNRLTYWCPACQR